MINAGSALVGVDERIISSGQTCLMRVFQIGAIIKTHEGWYMEKRWSVRVIKPRFLLRGKTTLNARYQDACRNSISRFPAPWTRNVISFPSGTDSVRVAALFSCIESIVISVRIYRNGFHRVPLTDGWCAIETQSLTASFLPAEPSSRMCLCNDN